MEEKRKRDLAKSVKEKQESEVREEEEEGVGGGGWGGRVIASEPKSFWINTSFEVFFKSGLTERVC